MTDFASQGRTRVNNAVDLSSCSNHQSYYTCLSRSASAAGTIIIQGFDERKITGGASGYLRQEFRELEILNEITKLRYEICCPENINASFRNALIQQFMKWKGTLYVPNNVHPSIRWNKSDPLYASDTVESSWQIVKKSHKPKENNSDATHFIAAKGSVPVMVTSLISTKNNEEKYLSNVTKKQKFYDTINVPNNHSITVDKKRKNNFEENTNMCPSKKRRISKTSIVPKGLIWDADNYSCAYDSILTILHSIWLQNPITWKQHFKHINKMMNYLAVGFEQETNGQTTLEHVRDKIRRILHKRNPIIFPYNHVGTDIFDVADFLLQTDATIASFYMKCVFCNYQITTQENKTSFVFYHLNTFTGTTAEYFHHHLLRKSKQTCDQCSNNMHKFIRFHVKPTIIAFTMVGDKMTVSDKIQLKDITYDLKGIVYLGGFHFTSRIITSDNNVWFHDGIETGRSCHKVGKLNDFNGSSLLDCAGRKARLIIYAMTDC